jgi:hypothetical protein
MIDSTSNTYKMFYMSKIDKPSKEGESLKTSPSSPKNLPMLPLLGLTKNQVRRALLDRQKQKADAASEALYWEAVARAGPSDDD